MNILQIFHKKNNNNSSFNFNAKDPVFKNGCRVSLRAGSIVIWDARMAHGSLPNRSTQFRSAQFFKMFKSSTVSTTRCRNRQRAILNILNRLPGTIEFTEETIKVLGLPTGSPLIYGLDSKRR
jgi:hypothetical protein